MKNSTYIRTLLVTALCVFALTTSNIGTDAVSAVPAANTVQAQAAQVNPMVLVNSPKSYLNKKIVMTARFDKFSTLGLDYKAAMRSSEKYISFLVKREDTEFDIPLSEMKLFITREKAEKLLDLKSNDKIQVVGTVFSDALGDTWVDADSITVIEKAPDKDGVKQ